MWEGSIVQVPTQVIADCVEGYAIVKVILPS